jgi:hypothetical protein
MFDTGIKVLPSVEGFEEFIGEVVAKSIHTDRYLISHPNGFLISTLNDKEKEEFNIITDNQYPRVIFARGDELKELKIEDDWIL